jgi:putative flippase GtrA
MGSPLASASTRSGLWFIGVGATASLIHMLVFALAESHIWPELANAMGFLVAFFVSFLGHRFLSFADTGTAVRTSLLRFAVTALAGFSTNEAVFVVLFRHAGWPSLLALFAGLVIAAAQTFVLSRFWAFKR